MGQMAGNGRRADDLADLIAGARRMPAARFILEIQARGHDPVQALNDLTPELLRLFQ
jgi:hypothetical protein